MTVPKVKVNGVYSITNALTGKLYIGSTCKHIPHRWRQHRHLLNKGCHYNQRLQSDWDEYGSDNFKFEIVEVLEDEYTIAFEQFWLNMFMAFDPRYGYNSDPTCGAKRGFKHSVETKAKISEHSKSWKRSPEHLAALNRGRQSEQAKLRHAEGVKSGWVKRRKNVNQQKKAGDRTPPQGT